MKMPGQSVFDMPFLKVYKCHINVGAREGAGTISFVFLNSTPLLKETKYDAPQGVSMSGSCSKVAAGRRKVRIGNRIDAGVIALLLFTDYVCVICHAVRW